MEKCLILGGYDWYQVEDEVNNALKQGYKIINSFPTATYDHPYICIILTREEEDNAK